MIDKLPPGAQFENGRIIGADGKPMSRNQIGRANGASATEEIQKLLSFVPGRGYEEYQGGAGQPIKAGSYIDFYMQHSITEPITLYGLTPHLHFRGKSMKYTLTLPDGPPS